MRITRAGGFAFAVLVAASLAGSATGTTFKGVTYLDKKDGYSITIPEAWQLVPRTVKQVQALVTTAHKKPATTALGDAYASIISTAAGRSQLKAYNFQAFDWPFDLTATPILTEVTVGITKVSRVLGKKDLKGIGATWANELSSNPGSKIVVPKQIELPAGPAEYIIGTIPAGGGLTTGVEFYLIPHGKKLYELGFQIDAIGLSQATLFGSIAQTFKFV